MVQALLTESQSSNLSCGSNSSSTNATNKRDLAKIYTATYVVQPGDTLLKVSMMYHVRSAELANVNNIFGDSIWPNQVNTSYYRLAL